MAIISNLIILLSIKQYAKFTIFHQCSTKILFVRISVKLIIN